MDNFVALFCGNIALLILSAYKLQPVISIAIRFIGNKFSPFNNIVGTYRLFTRLSGYYRITKMYIGVNKF